ncbi:C40 family peptidase [Tenacibaculum sp. 190524A02b]|uniref:NlpC/P60 family protein n=1 Tax=Tenacibaculum vairaonense TaxID=3137860 RepID=A0ABM9PJL6_9FLAO
MIKKLLLLTTLCLFIISCGSSTKVASTKTKKTRSHSSSQNQEVTIADKIVWTAVTYKDTPYKYGGLTRKGMDCSGLIYTSFKQRNIDLPRSSRLMYTKGYPISLRQVKRGDLLFFKTSRKSGSVNHVGLVTSVKKGDVRFIHATSSKGVLVSSLHEKYWKRAFIKAKRVL